MPTKIYQRRRKRKLYYADSKILKRTLTCSQNTVLKDKECSNRKTKAIKLYREYSDLNCNFIAGNSTATILEDADTKYFVFDQVVVEEPVIEESQDSYDDVKSADFRVILKKEERTMPDENIIENVNAREKASEVQILRRSERIQARKITEEFEQILTLRSNVLVSKENSMPTKNTEVRMKKSKNK